MKWLEVVDAVIAALRADVELIALLGGEHTYNAVAGRNAQVPSVEYTVVSDTLAENTEPVTLQMDVFAYGTAAVAQIEERIRAVLHRDRGQVLDTLPAYTRFAGGRTMDFPSDREVRHRSLDFEIEPARQEA